MDAQPILNRDLESFFRVLGTFWKHLVLVDILFILFARYDAHTVNYGILVTWSMSYIIGEGEHPLLTAQFKVFWVLIGQISIFILIALNSFIRMMDVAHGTDTGSLMAQFTGTATMTSLMIIYRKLTQ